MDAFDALGCSIRNANPGEVVPRISYLPRHEQFVEFVYGFLEQSGLLQVEGSRTLRTVTACPQKPAAQLMDELLADGTNHSYDHQLTYLVGTRLADCLTGNVDGVQLIFGSPEGREAATGMYSCSPINLPWIKQIESFLRDYVSRLGNIFGPIHILEMGAGTGGTTAVMAPMLCALEVPVVYTVTDLSSSLVAGLRKRFKQYPFLAFKTCNIEEQPPADLLQSQHIILATNCVHATHNLARSTSNIRQMLRSDGVLMMLEMTEPLPWVDLVFGLLEGWWLFDDGRHHALAPPEVWERTLHKAGYGSVDWTDGHRPEASIQRVIIAIASGPRYDDPSPLPSSSSSSSVVPTPPSPSADTSGRQATIDAYVEQYTRDFHLPSATVDQPSLGTGVLVTGATGSLGSHIVAHLARLPEVQTVVCLNRPRGADSRSRQLDALRSRGIHLDTASLGKIHVFQADTTKPGLGLSQEQLDFLLGNIKHIVHNAWPMSISRPIGAFEPQFQTLQNLLDLAAQIAAPRPASSSQRIGFQFISSIATVGQYSRRTGETLVPEIRITAESALCTGYSEAKLVCEHMLDETLHRFPSRLRPMAIRIGQISGASNTGYWNPVEHLAFMLKSSQTLRALPRLDANLSWCPVDTVAATLSELLLHPDVPASPIYHIENPIRQSWSAMLQILADALDAPSIIPFKDWIRRVRQFPGSVEGNPAARLVGFLDEQFVAMSCGGLVLDTACSQRDSPSLAKSQAVSEDLVRLYVRRWKEIGFLR
ncbi:hypothetical protein BDW59DRAFT_167804 [Aspergillus cavernicola]|uniref:Polyketide synthase n=1 Tax=Aspergillus cavernicola TaxID=176166 RepID=A0ABR4HAF1_9EURO